MNTQNFKEKIQKIADNLSKNGYETADESDSEVKKIAFEKKFQDIHAEILKPLIDSANEALNSTHNKIQVITNNDKEYLKSENRIFAQISLLDENNKNQNVLNAPYLLIEGYPTSETVKIVENNSGESGEELKITDLKEEMLEEVIEKFLSDNMQ